MSKFCNLEFIVLDKRMVDELKHLPLMGMAFNTVYLMVSSSYK